MQQSITIRQEMDYILYDERLDYLADLASKGRLISLSQVAAKFDCSERTVSRMLYHLRCKGISIKYSFPLKKFVIDSAPDK